jgi:hypothetical protein
MTILWSDESASKAVAGGMSGFSLKSWSLLKSERQIVDSVESAVLKKSPDKRGKGEKLDFSFDCVPMQFYG